MTILIFGYQGFIGSSIVNYLDERNIKWTGVNKIDINFESIEKSISKIISVVKPTVIIYAAGINQRFESTYFSSIYEHKFLTILSRMDAKLVYLSSTLVYGSPYQLPLRENSAVRPLGEYGLYKALCEDIVMTSQSWLVLRLSSIVSKSKITSAFYTIYSFLQDHSCDHLQMKFSNSIRDYMHVNLCGRTIVQSIYKSSNSIFNISASKSLSLSVIFYEMASLCTRNDVSIGFGPGRAEDPSEIIIDNTQLLISLDSESKNLLMTHSPISSFFND